MGENKEKKNGMKKEIPQKYLELIKEYNAEQSMAVDEIVNLTLKRLHYEHQLEETNRQLKELGSEINHYQKRIKTTIEKAYKSCKLDNKEYNWQIDLKEGVFMGIPKNLNKEGK